MGRRATTQYPQLLPGRASLQREEEFLLVVFGVVVEDAMKHQAAVVADEESYGCLHFKEIKQILLATYFQS